MSERRQTDVAVVGAGAAGVGVAVALSHLEIDPLVLDREGIGASFRNWPDETRLLTPSFPSNGFGLPDLNAIAPHTSPAVAADREHLSGAEYADYLTGVLLPCLVTALTVAREVSPRWALTMLARQAVAAIGFSLLIAWGGSLLVG